MNDTDHNETASRPSSESACSTAGMRENADQVKRNSTDIELLVLNVEDIQRNFRRMQRKLNAVSPGSTDEGGQSDGLPGPEETLRLRSWFLGAHFTLMVFGVVKAIEIVIQLFNYWF